MKKELNLNLHSFISKNKIKTGKRKGFLRKNIVRLITHFIFLFFWIKIIFRCPRHGGPTSFHFSLKYWYTLMDIIISLVRKRNSLNFKYRYLFLNNPNHYIILIG